MNFVFFWRKSIRAKLLVTSFLLLLIPISVLGWVSYRIYTQESESLIQNNLKNMVSMASVMTKSYEEEMKSGRLSEAEAKEQLKVKLVGAKHEKDGSRSVNTTFDLGKNGYFFILDEQGNLLGHPSLEGQNILNKQTSSGFYYIKDLIQKAQNGGGFTRYNWPLPNDTKEAEKITYSLKVAGDWHWIVAAGSYMQDYNSGQKHILNIIWITIISCWLLGGIIMYLFSRHISKPIQQISKQAAKMASGDLSDVKLTVRNKDEIGELANAFMQMHQHLRQIIEALLTQSDNLTNSSYDLGRAISETTLAGNQVAISVQEIAAGNETQARSIQESALSMEEMAVGIQRIASTTSAAFEASETTLTEANEGNRLIETTSGQMTAIQQTVNQLSTIISKLDERSQHINGIVEVITELSAQTHLLALNASIEAARAGEEGKGFAVVASEVKKLAERSAASASEVSNLIQFIVTDMKQAAATMERSRQEVDSGAEALHHTGEAFARILGATQQVVMQIQEASAAAEEMSASSQEMAASLQEMERMAHHSNESTHVISASTEEQIAEMEELSASGESLGNMASELQFMAHRFKL